MKEKGGAVMLLNGEVHFRDLVLAGGVVIFYLVFHQHLIDLALVIMISVLFGCVFAYVSGLLLGRMGFLLASAISFLLILKAVVYILGR